ncbi:unnamed protein product [Brachionus calyciflorus]|uniref:14 kDa phosphohistidine phosphatase n=1 Tax=Brachionus calyciflorus TaxID=104777 RepID=A0A814L845_9BILA|nr:unnamed protein product [Brachionus calyciflorus]
MSQVEDKNLSEIASVNIDSNGRFKYILIKLVSKNSKQEKYVVRADILDDFEKNCNVSGIDIECVGGGRILHEPEKKTIFVYGYSLGFGLADHKISVELLKEKYSYYVSITFSNEGY